jgi:hypothetical protein
LDVERTLNYLIAYYLKADDKGRTTLIVRLSFSAMVLFRRMVQFPCGAGDYEA